MLIRPMTDADLPAAERVGDAGRRAGWAERTRHLVRTDPAGCWVAEDETGVVGAVTSLRREALWCLASYAVLPEHRAQGIGKPLLAAALAHGRACTRKMLSASADTEAVRHYHQAGFALHPELRLAGTVDRSAIPVVDKVREGSAADFELMDSLDRSARGAGHGPDHPLLLATGRLLVSDTTTGSGYAYLDHRGQLALLAASNRRTATRLLWVALAEGSARASLRHVTDANQWVLDVGFAAGLELRQEGYLALRGMKPPAPYVHHGALL